MTAFDPNAYGRPPPKPRRVPETVSQGKHRLFGLRWLFADITEAPIRILAGQPSRIIEGPLPTTTSSPPPGQSEQTQTSVPHTSDRNDIIFELGRACDEVPPSQSSEHQISAPTVQSQGRRDSGYGTTVIKWPVSTHSGESTQGPVTGSRTSPDPGCPAPLPTPSSKMTTRQNANGTIANGDLLKQLQSTHLQQISRRREAKKRDKDKYATTSLKDLDLARAPVDPKRPASSKRVWAQDLSLSHGQEGGKYASAAPARREDSVIPQASTERSGQVGTTTTQTTLLGRSKWATKEELKDDQHEVDSNAWGSAAPSDATRGTNLSDESFGKMLDKRDGDYDVFLPTDFDGNVMPAPADWEERPRYSNNNATFKHRFKEWHASVAGDKKYRFSNGVPYIIIRKEILDNENLLPDGLSMVRRGMAINATNAGHYGYSDDPEDAVKYAQHTSASDYEDWGKLDPTDEDNQRYRKETTEDLVSNWLRHLANSRDANIEIGRQQEVEHKTLVVEKDIDTVSKARYRPKLNIYLRPATKLDLEEMTRIYNCHISHGTGPSETEQVPKSAMQIRMEQVQTSDFPFIVAAKRNQKGAREIQPMDEDELSWRQNLPVTHRKRVTLTRIEMLAGFCCANDLTAPDFVEHISAEIELYVDPQYKKMGVGKCLLDKMLEICDRSHRLTTDCAFHCDQNIRHLYGPGGDRQAHKLWFLLRKWHSPKPAAVSVETGRRYRKSPFAKKTEDDYEKWLKSWLESLGFEVEAHLKKIGAKQGR